MKSNKIDELRTAWIRSMNKEQIFKFLDKLEDDEEKFECLSMCDHQQRQEGITHVINMNDNRLGENGLNSIAFF